MSNGIYYCPERRLSIPGFSQSLLRFWFKRVLQFVYLIDYQYFTYTCVTSVHNFWGENAKMH